jgi:hypothetical protein
MRRVLAAIAIAGLIAPGVAQAGPKPVTKLELRRLPPRIATRRVSDQLADLLIEASRPGRAARPPTRPLQDVWYRTRPRSTNTAGLCATDEVIVRFEPVTSRARGAATPVMASSVEAKTLYRFISPPSAATVLAEVKDWAGQQARCGAVEPWRTRFFAARDEEAATEAVWRLRAVILAAGQPGASEPPCEYHPLKGHGDCLSVLTGMTTDRLSDVDSCPSEKGRCWSLLVGDQFVTIYAASGDAAVGASRVDISDALVMYHERVD